MKLVAKQQTTIENCKFAFKCPLNWDALTETDDSEVRYCGSCEQNVYLCYDSDEAHSRAERGQCVALQPLEADRETLVGLIEPPRDRYS